MNIYTILIAIILILLAVFSVANIIASFFFYNLAIARNSKEFLWKTDDTPTDNKEETKKNNDENWIDDTEHETVSIKTHDSLNLYGCYIKAKKVTNKTAILIHGYTSSGIKMLSYARIYYNLGYNILIPDNRAHGNSEGNFIGFGWIDRLDYLKWMDFILQKAGQDTQIVLHGVSMGGAAVMMLSGEKLPSQVKCIIEDCGYTSVKEQLGYQLKQLFNLPNFPIIYSTSLLTKIRAGYYFSEASALKQVQKTKIPMLFIHGDNDTFVPFEMVNKLYAACNSEKGILVVKGAGHGEALAKDKISYKNKVIEFIGKHIQ